MSEIQYDWMGRPIRRYVPIGKVLLDKQWYEENKHKYSGQSGVILHAMKELRIEVRDDLDDDQLCFSFCAPDWANDLKNIPLSAFEPVLTKGENKLRHVFN